MRAIEAGKHVYPEKPAAESLQGALRLARAARAAGVTHGMVHDKLFLPGVIKLRRPRMLRKVWGTSTRRGRWSG